MPRLQLAALWLAVALAVRPASYAAESDLRFGAGSAHDKVRPAIPERSPDLWKHLELKRQWTERGTPEEGSKTTLRLEATPRSWITLVRIDLPFVDKKNGDPMSPHLGDLKLKLESRAIPFDGTQLFPSLEVTFPTANPTSLGNGKYQLSPGIEWLIPLWASGKASASGPWDLSVKPLVRQVFSVAGYDTSKDINYTKFEPAFKLGWRKKLSLKLTPKMVFDYERSGDSGAVFELEPAWNISRHWRTELTLGHELWGRGLPTIYGKKVELSLRFNF